MKDAGDGERDRASIQTTLDAPYARVHSTGNGRELLWDVYRSPSGGSSAPLALLIHGGGWRAGSREMMSNAGRAFAHHHYIAIAPEYRLVGEAAWPACLEDVRTAIRTVHLRAEDLGADPGRIFLIGFSAGAHLALLAAGDGRSSGATDTDGLDAVAGIAAFFPPVNIDAHFASMMGIDPTITATVSPTLHAAHLPPTIVFCGDEDTVTPAASAMALYQTIRKAGGTADLRLYSDLDHEFVSLPGMLECTVRDTVDFFRRTVIEKSQHDAALAELKRRWTSSPRTVGP